MYLAKEYKGRQFDAIFDTIGIQPLFVHSPAYLKIDGSYVNVGSFAGVLRTVLNAFTNWFWPTMLGGTPRKFFFHSTFPDMQVQLELLEMLKTKKLKVVIEKVYSMEDALEVSPCVQRKILTPADQSKKGYDKIVSRRARGKQIVTVRSS